MTTPKPQAILFLTSPQGVFTYLIQVLYGRM